MAGKDSLDVILTDIKRERIERAGKLYSAAKVLISYQNGGYIDKDGCYVVNVNAGKELLVIRYDRDFRFPTSYLNVSVSKKGPLGHPYIDNVLRMEFDNQYRLVSNLTIYEPGDWEKLLENAAEGYVKSPVSPVTREQIASQRPTVQASDDEDASRR